MMDGGDLYELVKILGHSNIKMTERYAKLGREHITKTKHHREGDLEPEEEAGAERRRPIERRLGDGCIGRATKT
ncbi:hypothetical protein [Granulicella mallensis]|uniref:hypothetical protein n=1 Tax=Granulicella mallensis TaxID=940614 RepID=UPI0001D9EFA2|nr:hypothetical protein [Granulicella mallensis]